MTTIGFREAPVLWSPFGCFSLVVPFGNKSFELEE